MEAVERKNFEGISQTLFYYFYLFLQIMDNKVVMILYTMDNAAVVQKTFPSPPYFFVWVRATRYVHLSKPSILFTPS